MIKVTQDVLDKIEKAAVFFRNDRGWKPPFHLYSPFDFEETEIKTSVGKVKIHQDKSLPPGMIYLLPKKAYV